MDESADVLVHESAFPRIVKTQLVEGLRARRLDQKFLYLGLKQTLRWLALHEAHSPARRDAATLAIYDEGFRAAAARARGSILHLVGLAPGGGQKESRCLELLRQQGKTVFFTACDASLEMALAAHEEAISRLRGLQSTPVVCDLHRCSTLPALLRNVDPGGTERLVTFFGSIHNFPPGEILPRLLNAVRSQDTFLLSANLLPEEGYDAALGRILPQYQNLLTEAWMGGLLDDLGIHDAGSLRFALSEGEDLPGLKRIEAHFEFRKECRTTVYGEPLQFQAGETLGLFSSYRYTVRFLRALLEQHGFQVDQHWVPPSGEEGVLLCRRATPRE